MPKFELTVNGTNFLVRLHPTHRLRKYGFCTKFFLEADSPEAAENASISHLTADEYLRGVVHNQRGDDAMMHVEKITEIAKFPKKTALPRLGLVWYPEDGEPPEGLPRRASKRIRKKK
jgi:hypothetical protein